MPARKPAGLIERHETAAEKDLRAAREASMRPARKLTTRAPARLDGHPVAEAAWRRILRTYGELESEIVTRLDQDLLVDYCILVEQIGELDTMRKAAYLLWLELGKQHDQLVHEEKIDEALMGATKVIGAFEAIIKLDGRADRKRDLLFKLRQSLYLTPRARAGTAPAQKEKEEPPDELEQLLDDVNDFVNGDPGHAR